MSENKINFSDYKASGVYYEERDNSISAGTRQSALRLAVGFNGRAPFNRPIYIANTADCDDFLGPIDRKLERKGCYTNRAIRTMITKAPVYALNLLPIDTASKVDANKDLTSVCKLDFMPTETVPAARKMRYCDMFDRSKFWIADENAMMFNLDKSAGDSITGSGTGDSKNSFKNCAFFAAGNCGTSDISIIVRKAEGLTGFNVTFLDWYGKEDDIPYAWIDPYDYVADYFVQVIALKGNLTNYANYAVDPIWKEYFDANGLKKEKLNKFLRLDAVTVVGNWVGCVIPDFEDKQGKNWSIDYLINKTANKTGLMFGLNTTALETLAYGVNKDEEFEGYFMDLDGDGVYANGEKTDSYVDLVGNTVDNITDNKKTFAFLSHADITFNANTRVNINNCHLKNNEFFVAGNAEDTIAPKGFMPQVGDYVKAEDGTYTKIVKKTYAQKSPAVEAGTQGAEETPGYVFTTLKAIKNCSNEAAAYRVNDDPLLGNIETEEHTLHQDYMVYAVEEAETNPDKWIDNAVISVRKSISDAYAHLGFISLPGLKLTNRHLPGYTTAAEDGTVKADIEAGVNKIYEMLNDTGIRRGLLNDEIVDYRYIVDTLGGGLDTNAGGKHILSELAAEKEHCTALINLPAISDFSKYVEGAPCYYDGDGTSISSFNVEYITTEGNPDFAVTTATPGAFSLPTADQGNDHAAFFTPYLKYAQGTGYILIPPAADVSNTFMNKFTGGDPYKTVANLNGIVSNVNVKGLEVDFDETDRGYLEPFGVNPIITYNGINMIFGDRTAYQTVNSDLNFLHVREILNTINIQARNILHDYVFTYNVATTRKEIYDKLKPMLDAMKDSNALLKYEIQVDEENNTKEVIDEKFCIVDIGVWVSPNMEKIITRVTLNRSTTA